MFPSLGRTLTVMSINAPRCRETSDGRATLSWAKMVIALSFACLLMGPAAALASNGGSANPALATPLESTPDHPAGPLADDGAEVALFLPWSAISSGLLSFLQDFTTTDQENLGDQPIQVNGLNWQASGITSTVVSSFSASQPVNSAYPIQSKDLSIAISVGRLSIDQIVLRQVGSATVKVHIQATCDPIHLRETSAQAKALVGYSFTPSTLTTVIQQFDLQWPANSWDVGTISCQGPNGLDQELKATLTQQLQSANNFKAAIQQKLAAKMQSEVDQLIASFKSPTVIPVPGNPLPVRLRFSRFETHSLGLMVFGTLDWNAGGKSPSIRPLSLTEVPLELKSSSVPQFVAAQSAWQELVLAELSVQRTNTLVNLNSQASFQNLLESRFKQLIVWPDLFNYAASSVFTFSLSPPQISNITWLADGSAQAAVQSHGWILSERALGPGSVPKSWNYIALSGHGLAKLQPLIAHGILSLTAVASGTQLQAQFGDDYVRSFAPNTYLAPTLLTRLKALLETPYTQQVSLPSLSLGPAGVAKFNGWVPVSGQLIAVPIESTHQ